MMENHWVFILVKATMIWGFYFRGKDKDHEGNNSKLTTKGKMKCELWNLHSLNYDQPGEGRENGGFGSFLI